jgi:hypothetical protein
VTRLLNPAISIYLITCSALSLGQDVAEFSANYQASANGIAAEAQRTLQRLEGSLYRLTNSLEASISGQVIARLEQASEFQVDGQGLVPSTYSYLLTGISSEARAINYNWDARIALSTEDDESRPLELTEGVMDQLSHQFALRQKIRQGEFENLEFQIIDEDEIELHHYRVIGEEQLSTPLGLLNSTRLERVREDADDERRTEIWLANDWEFLLVKIEQANRSGLRIELELENATVDGSAVTALP